MSTLPGEMRRAGMMREQVATRPVRPADLHLGNLRTALLAWLFARSTDRRFLLRIEDLDAGRVRPGLAEQQRADLEALGLDFDGEPVVQSRRAAAYTAALEVLADRTYECFCTRREIAEAASAPHGLVGRYPGTCRELTPAQRAERRRARTPALRLRADGAAADRARRCCTARCAEQVDDIVVRRNDGVAAYHLAVVVDDADWASIRWSAATTCCPQPSARPTWRTLLGHAAADVRARTAGRQRRRRRRLAKRDGAVTLADLAALGSARGRCWGCSLTHSGCPRWTHPRDLLDHFDPDALPNETPGSSGLSSCR